MLEASSLTRHLPVSITLALPGYTCMALALGILSRHRNPMGDDSCRSCPSVFSTQGQSFTATVLKAPIFRCGGRIGSIPRCRLRTLSYDHMRLIRSVEVLL